MGPQARLPNNAVLRDEVMVPTHYQSVTVDHTEAQTQEHISTQISALGLRGLDALAFIFCARHGSLEAAFDYMDANSSGQVSLNAWSVSLLVMHIKLEELVGMTPHEIFGMIDTHNSSTISRNEFLIFFQGVQQGTENAKGQALSKDPEFKAIVDEEASLLAALGSLDQKLGGNSDQSKKDIPDPIARKARPPRPKALKLPPR
jgi:hypothetical protein